MHSIINLRQCKLRDEASLSSTMPQGRPAMSIVSPEPRTLLFPLAVSRPWTDAEAPNGTLCLVCGELLSLHQPEINSPERLLGTCDACGSWHLVDLDRAITVLLPDADGLRTAEIGR